MCSTSIRISPTTNKARTARKRNASGWFLGLVSAIWHLSSGSSDRRQSIGSFGEYLQMFLGLVNSAETVLAVAFPVLGYDAAVRNVNAGNRESDVPAEREPEN